MSVALGFIGSDWWQTIATGFGALGSTVVAVAALIVSRRSFNLSRASEDARRQELELEKLSRYEASLNGALADFVSQARAYLDSSVRSVRMAMPGVPREAVTPHPLMAAAERLTFVAVDDDLRVVVSLQLLIYRLTNSAPLSGGSPYEELERAIDVLQRWRTNPSVDADATANALNAISPD